MFPGCSRNPRLGRLSLFAFLTAAALSFGVALQVEKTLLAFLQKRFQLVLERGLGAHAGDAFFRGEGLFDGEVQLPALVQAQDLDLDLLLFLQVVPDVFDVRIGDFADMDQTASAVGELYECAVIGDFDDRAFHDRACVNAHAVPDTPPRSNMRGNYTATPRRVSISQTGYAGVPHPAGPPWAGRGRLPSCPILRRPPLRPVRDRTPG